jgi:organic hydroperoxide reductase OsmC/OhrA
MTPFPHRYTATATGFVEGYVELRAGRLPRLLSAPPQEFDGPGDRWSPETLLVSAIADCFALTFRAVARVMELPWRVLHCRVIGTVDRVDRIPQFTRFQILARLTVLPGTSQEVARRALEKAGRGCAIANSLKSAVQLEVAIGYADHDQAV